MCTGVHRKEVNLKEAVKSGAYITFFNKEKRTQGSNDDKLWGSDQKYMGKLMEDRTTLVRSVYANSSQCGLPTSGDKLLFPPLVQGETSSQGKFMPSFQADKGRAENFFCT